MANFELAFKLVIENEGGLVDDKDDRGSTTKFGISQKAYPNEDIVNLTLERAKQLYKQDYWTPIKGDNIYSQIIAESIFDFGVNAGVRTSIKLAQKVVGAKDDGIIGENTIAMINSFNEEKFIPLFAIEKIKRYRDICLNKPDQKKFFFGWTVRTLKGL